MPPKPVHFKNEGEDLFGMLHLPAASRRRKSPAVLFLHGFMSHKVESHRIFVKMARLLESGGIASLRFDFRGCGDSGSNSEQMTLASMLSDAQVAFHWLRNHRQVDGRRLVVLGMSLGGGIAATLVGHNVQVKGLVLWAPVSNLMECLQIRAAGQGVKHILESPKVDYMGNLLGHDFFSEFNLFQPLEAVKQFKGPVLLIQGTKDEMVPLHQSQQYEKTLRGTHSRNRHLWIQGSNHIFASNEWEKKVLHATADFLEKVLSRKRG